MGVLIHRTTDKDLYEKAINETLSIFQSAEQIPLRKSERPIYQDNRKADQKPSKYKKVIRGYCLRCEERIDYDPFRPYCGNCFSIWVQYENRSFEETVCHRCGEYETTSMNFPQCSNCYTEYQKELPKQM